MDKDNKAELKRVWLEALRSGKYKQTKGTLHNLHDGGFCCLGVAAKVWGVATPEQMGVKEWENYKGEQAPSGEGDVNYYAALDELAGGWPRQPFIAKGILMNDEGKSFAEIADMIEKEWVIDPLSLRSFDEYGENNPPVGVAE
jgi:hypothetical protein